MAVCKASDETKPYVSSNPIGEVYKGGTLIYKAESDPITLSKTVTQNANSLNWGSIDYEITEDWETLTVIDSYWGKSYGEFQTVLYLIDGSTTKTLVSRSGGYGGHTMAEEPIVASGAQYAVKKGQIFRLSVGAGYNPNVSGQHQTTSWITFKLT